ncbi:TBC1 domain family member 2B [Golovinomyces cichoracearum]|uniref:TBC1 domain family member 2B n=1 Tax=Golovinomyces cichoracearum TaxID=62708 RepID=A0A420IFZ0_9PEZI|nr:TBC1 domain family member 2B [Golovinomyces cichoracearum]
MVDDYTQSVSDEAHFSCKPHIRVIIISRAHKVPLVLDARTAKAPKARLQHPPPSGLPAHPVRNATLTVLPSYLFKDPQTSTTSQCFVHVSPETIINRKLSEASQRLPMNYEIEYQPQSSNGRQTPERHEVVTENFSRPRQASVKGQKKTAWPHNVNGTFTPVLSRCQEKQVQITPHKTREIEISTGSLHSTTPTSISGLRPSNSTPDCQNSQATPSKQRIFTSPIYRPNQSFSKPDYTHSISDPNTITRQDPSPLQGGVDGEETRSSFRSAVTTNSSFQGTSGTERSSVLTKSSSGTSIYGREESINVGENLMMNEKAFIDEKSNQKSHAENTEKTIMSKHEPDFKEYLILPPSEHVVIRDSTAIFETYGTDSPRLSTKELSIAIKETGVEDEFSPNRPMTRSTTTQFDETRDRYGFRKKTQYVSLEEYEAWNKPYTVYLARRKKKWIALMRQHNLPTTSPNDFPVRSDKVKRFIRKGIPPSWRGAAWFHYAGGPAMLAKHPGVYEDLVRRSLAGDMTQTDDEIIERDLNRTFPDNIKFKPDPDPQSPLYQEDPIETPILKSLRRVLRAFSIYHPKIGYCQSLNFLAGLLLLFMDEEKSFWMLNIITRIFLPGTHSLTLEGANVDLGVLMSSIKEMMPSVWAKIGNELDGKPSVPSFSAPMRLPPITLCTTAWFMSCFIGTLPIETTLRVWDSFFYEGSKTLFRIALTIFKLGEPQIRAVNDPMEIFQVVQGMPRGMMDCNHLMETCFKRRGGFVKLSQDDIERGREERRRGYEEERKRMATGTGAVIPGLQKTKGVNKSGNSFFGRGKKERIGFSVQV